MEEDLAHVYLEAMKKCIIVRSSCRIKSKGGIWAEGRRRLGLTRPSFKITCGPFVAVLMRMSHQVSSCLGDVERLPKQLSYHVMPDSVCVSLGRNANHTGGLSVRSLTKSQATRTTKLSA